MLLLVCPVQAAEATLEQVVGKNKRCTTLKFVLPACVRSGSAVCLPAQELFLSSFPRPQHLIAPVHCWYGNGGEVEDCFKLQRCTVCARGFVTTAFYHGNRCGEVLRAAQAIRTSGSWFWLCVSLTLSGFRRCGKTFSKYS